MQQAEQQLRQAEKLRQSARFDEAIACIESLLQAYPHLAAAHNNLGLIWAGKQDYPKAVACFRDAIRIRADFAVAYCNLGSVLLIQGDHQGGEAATEEALRIRPDFALPHLNRAAIWLRKGDFERGLPEFEWRRLGAANRHDPVAAPLWDGTASRDSSILLHAEHGIGDTLQFVRYASSVKRRCGTVVLQCDRSLLPLLQHCAGINRLIARGETPPQCHFQAPLMSLPLILRTTLATIPADVPYVFANRDLADAWQKRLAVHRGFKVGIAWQGNPRYPMDNLRSLPLRHFQPLTRIPGVTLFSLQKGAGTDQLAGLGAELPVVDFGTRFDTTAGAFMDTAAVMKNPDLIVTSDTAVAHLAGAMGLPVWVALGKAADWRWLEEREDSPWYPTMRLFRQAGLGNWEALFERIAGDFKSVADGDRSRLFPQCAAPLRIQAPIGAGELLDRITILEIKCRSAANQERRQTAESELGELVTVRDQTIRMTPEIGLLVVELRALNERLWDAEDRIRLSEQQGDFGPKFVELARTIYLSNDARSAVKQQINSILGSSVRDMEDYPSVK